MKRASHRTKVFVGGFLVLVAAIVVAGSFLTGDISDFVHANHHYHIHAANVGGVHQGSDVKVGGISIGRVGDMNIISANGTPLIDVEIIVAEKYSALITIETSAKFETLGILGDKFIALTPGPGSRDMAPDGAVLALGKQINAEEVIDQASAAVANLSRSLERFHSFAEGLPGTEEVQHLSSDIRQSATSLRQVLVNLNQKEGAVAVLSKPETGQRISRVLVQLDSMSSSLASTSKKIDDGSGTLGQLVNDPSLYESVQGVFGKTGKQQITRATLRRVVNLENERLASKSKRDTLSQ